MRHYCKPSVTLSLSQFLLWCLTGVGAGFPAAGGGRGEDVEGGTGEERQHRSHSLLLSGHSHLSTGGCREILVRWIRQIWWGSVCVYCVKWGLLLGAEYLEKQQSELSNELSLTKKSLSIMMVSHCWFWCCTLVTLDRPIGSLECSIYS